jgi:arylsulfatase A-like enzyme
VKRSDWLRAACIWGWTSSALLIARLTVLIVLEVKLRHRSPDVVMWDISHQAGEVALHSAAAGLLMVFLSCKGRDSRRGSLIAHLCAIIASLSTLSGWPLGEVHQVPGADSTRNRVGWLLFLLASFGLTHLQRKLSKTGWSPKHGYIHAAAALCSVLALPAAFYWTHGTVSVNRSLVNTVREFAFEEDTWKTTRINPYQRPCLKNLTPSFDYRVDGGDRPAIFMPPPSELTITINEEDAGSHFQSAIGIGRDSIAGSVKGSPVWKKNQQVIEIRFEVELDGVSMHDSTIKFDRSKGADLQERAWAYIGRNGEIPVSPGQRLTLRTSWANNKYKTDVNTPVAACGFGSPELVRRSSSPRESSSPETPNIVLIVMDTLRADRMSCYGYETETTPNLDALAERGLLHEQARSTSSWTWPSTASILTGLPPETHGVVSDGQCYLDSSLLSLPEALEKRGYTTVGFTCNPLIAPNKNFHQGFEEFDSYPTFRKTDTTIGTIENFLDRYAGTRFFLYLHLVDTHDRYELTDSARSQVGLPASPPKGMPPSGFKFIRPPLLQGKGHDNNGDPITSELFPEEFQGWLHHTYDAAVATADEYVGRVLDKLSALGLDDETIIVFTSDHGEELFEHGLLSHGHSLHEELVRVPLILAGPGIPSGARTDKLISNRHIAPTLAKFGGVELPAVPLPQDLSQPQTWAPEPVISSTHQGWWNGMHRLEIYSITTEEWVLHWAPTGAGWMEEPEPNSDGMWRLYNRPSDPHEKVDLAQARPEIAARLLKELKERLETARSQATGLSFGVGDAGLDLLRGIGYIQDDDR